MSNGISPLTLLDIGAITITCVVHSSVKASSVEVRYGSTDLNAATRVTASSFIDHSSYDSTTFVRTTV